MLESDSILAVVVRPSLWMTALGAATALAPDGWWRRAGDGKLPSPQGSRGPGLPRGETDMVDRISSSGSCVRCRRSLGLASVKVEGEWSGSATCASGGDCPLERRDPAVAEEALFARPRRHFRRRAPKELSRA